MTYSESIDYLYNQAPMFQQIGKKAYKNGLETTEFLDAHYGHPHRTYATIHVAGTNGKGSTSHLIASVLQCAGYKVGLYTSPHLRDFRERIRVNGVYISETDVVSFVEQAKDMIAELNPSFFEITTAMAFQYFEKSEVDVAVIEVGLGGRLDCTNIINPELSIITNISIDHTDILGNDILDIAKEKGGVIKRNTPIVIGETDATTSPLFTEIAKEKQAPIFFADQLQKDKPVPPCSMKGVYQQKNTATALTALQILQRLGWRITGTDIAEGFLAVERLTGIKGRWQQLSTSPRVICDTGHNEAGIRYIVSQLQNEKYNQLHIVIGMVSDKKIDKMLSLLPKEAIYYFTNANIPRALSAEALKNQAKSFDLNGDCFNTVKEALDSAKQHSKMGDLIFVGGSNFIVAEII